MIHSKASDEAIGSDAHTPMMRQYFAARAQHPDTLLFFRMGDFYEMFYRDAEVASELLGITLTSRSKDKSGTRIPMAGVPAKAVDSYIRRLLDAGQRVAICEQMEDPKRAEGLVDRAVIQVVTPGTFMDEARLDDARALHLVAIVFGNDQIGVSWVDLSTGKFYAEDAAGAPGAEHVLLRISPAECIYPDGLRISDVPLFTWLAEQFPSCAFTPFSEWHFEATTARERLLAHFRTRTLEGFGCEGLGSALGAAGAIIHYLQETQRQALPHIARLIPVSSNRRMRLDAATLRALDLVEVARTGELRGSLLGIMDRTRTAMGARLLREWLLAPLLDREEILLRQNAVGMLAGAEAERAALGEALRRVRDVERLAARLPLGRVNGRDLKALEHSLRAIPEIVAALAGCESRALTSVRERLPEAPLQALAEAIGAAIVDEPPPTVKEGGVIRDGFDPDLDQLRSAGREGVDWIARFQDAEVARTGIPNLKVGYNRVFGYYIEITNSHRSRIPSDYVRRQTVKNAERYVTPLLKEQEDRVLGARERAEALELELFGALRVRVQEEMRLLQETAAALSELDALLALAAVAADEGYARPEIVEGAVLEIHDGRHPVLGARGRGADFTPNDTRLGGEHATLAVITGPNMAGKSTYIRQNALIVILAQIGSFVPAASVKVGLADRVFTRVGASDELSRGHSTFMVEMTETANILNNATSESLVILDEVGRGTSTLDGISIAWAIAEQLAERIGARTLFATHYHELTALAERYPGKVANLNVAVREWRDEIVFLHKIVPGATDKSYGIHVARLAGVPGEVLARARDNLARLEEEHRGVEQAPRGGARQLDLFAAEGAEIAERLRNLDLDSLTPLAALTILHELKEQAKFRHGSRR